MEANEEKNIAIIIAHGMGQQVKFQILSSLAEIVCKGLQLELRLPETKIKNDSHTSFKDIPVIEIKDALKDGSDKNIDLYEVYWAPFTEGMIKAYEITYFLIMHGIKYLFSLLLSGEFKRYIFKDPPQVYKIKRTKTILSIVLFLVFFCGTILIYLTTAFIFIESLIKFLGLSDNAHTSINLDLKVFFSPIILGGLVCIAISKIKEFLQKERNLPKRGMTISFLISISIVGLALFMVYTDIKIIFDIFKTESAILIKIQAFILGILFYIRDIFVYILQHLPFFDISDPLKVIKRSFRLVYPFSVLLILFYLRAMYIQFLGDVVIYVSSHTLNRFDEVRSKIKDAGKLVFEYVYGLNELQPKDQKHYDKVIVIGHSLGSVIAYDCLNGIIKKDEGFNKEYAERTEALVTFGSPLNKTAFLFRNQVSKYSEFRERLALEKQPLVKDYDYRPDKWINIYSNMDIISGKLRFYDPSSDSDNHPVDINAKEEVNSKKVKNISDTEARTLILAHSEYWNNDQLPNEIAVEIRSAFQKTV